MSGLHDAFDELVADVPVYGDLDRAIEQAEREERRRVGVVVGLSAAAAAAVIVGVLSVNGDASNGDDPVQTPTSTPTEVVPPATDGSIYFVADSAAGAELTAPLSHFQAEVEATPMDLYLSRLGQPVRRVVETKANERCPVASPDGSRLAYFSGTNLVVAPIEADGGLGSAELRLDLQDHGLYRPDAYRGTNGYGLVCPQWSPDSRRLGYLVILGDPGRFKQTLYDPVTAEVHAVSLDGEDRLLASFDVVDWDTPVLAWSPQGDQVAYTTLDGVWLAPVDGGSPELLWRTEEIDLTQLNPVDGDRPVSLVWSTRDQLAFTVRGFAPTEPDNPMSGGRDTYTLMVVDSGSGRVRLETAAGSALGIGGAGESWSPDGSRLVFTGPADNLVLYDVATDSLRRVRLNVSDGEKVDAATWSPDGQQLLARTFHQDHGISYVSFDVDGSSREVRTPPSWGLDWVGLDDVTWGSR
ncbi:MAG TPA: hypothetical protein VFK41_01740 [Nocardioidaceae bacterium]|nr:hypothetical protein [Nocardioidaceae bacterium]